MVAIIEYVIIISSKMVKTVVAQWGEKDNTHGFDEGRHMKSACQREGFPKDAVPRARHRGGAGGMGKGNEEDYAI